jgi:hypothetical protein
LSYTNPQVGLCAIVDVKELFAKFTSDDSDVPMFRTTSLPLVFSDDDEDHKFISKLTLNQWYLLVKDTITTVTINCGASVMLHDGTCAYHLTGFIQHPDKHRVTDKKYTFSSFMRVTPIFSEPHKLPIIDAVLVQSCQVSGDADLVYGLIHSPTFLLPRAITVKSMLFGRPAKPDPNSRGGLHKYIGTARDSMKLYRKKEHVNYNDAVIVEHTTELREELDKYNNKQLSEWNIL